MDYFIIQTSTDSLPIAKIIAKKLVDFKLSPCVHILNSPNSYYLWDKKTVDTKEYIIQIKSDSKRRKKVLSLLKELHNYNNPELISKKITIESSDYEKWFNNEMEQR